MTRIFFVTGTDTDSGKTTAVAALMQTARLSSFSVCGLKPVASGCSEAGGVLINPDVLSLQENS
jgi:dethiobiotin synthetase